VTTVPLLALALVLGGWSCSGEVGDGGDDGDGPGFGPGAQQAGSGAPGEGPQSGAPGAAGEPPPQADPYSVSFECDAAADPSAAPLSRLTMPQYDNTLEALFTDVPGTMAAARGALDQLPIDGEQDESFADMDRRISQRHIDGFVQVADAIASHVTSDPARLAALAGDCANAASLDSACLRAFITDFGRLAHRRPLSDAQVARYEELADGVDALEAYRGVLFSMLIAPPFLYHLEIDGSDVGDRGDLLALSPHELASRLSYHLWQAPPDVELRAVADDGSLMDDDVFAAQVERLYADPRALATVVRFFGEWYRLEIFGGFATTPAFETFAGGTAPDRALYDAAVEEVEALVRYHVESGNYDDLLDSELSFASDPELAALYGVDPWDGVSEPGSFPPGERAGVLSRVAMLVSSNHTTNPFKRGAYIQREILCQPVEPPANLPPGALTPPPFDPNASTRERFEAKVESPTCAGCHATFTPFGMALEAYDGLGRFRSEEELIDDDGNVVGSVPVDTQVTALIGGQQQELSGPAELARALADSEQAKECFARHYFRYSFRRVEQPGDECVLASMLERVGPGGSLRDALRQVALDPAFKRRLWR
jgi:hypothetical protein